jgi:hypothetical protein
LSGWPRRGASHQSQESRGKFTNEVVLDVSQDQPHSEMTVSFFCAATCVSKMVGYIEHCNTLKAAEKKWSNLWRMNQSNIKDRCDDKSNNPPLTKVEWKGNIAKFLLPVVNYIFTQLKNVVNNMKWLSFFAILGCLTQHG